MFRELSYQNEPITSSIKYFNFKRKLRQKCLKDFILLKLILKMKFAFS